MKRKILALILTALLLLTNAAWAAPGDTTLYLDLSNGYNRIRQIYDVTVIGEMIYATCYDPQEGTHIVISLKAGESEPQSYTLVPEALDDEALSDFYSTSLFTWEDRLMLLDERTGWLYEVTLADGQVTLSETLQLQLLENENRDEDDVFWGTEYVQRPWVDGNTLYTITNDYSSAGSGITLTGYDLTDGTGHVIGNRLDSEWVAPGRAGELLIARANEDDWTEVATLCSISLADGSLSEVCKLMSNQIYGLTYDSANNRVIYINDGVIYATTLEGAQEELGTLPIAYFYNGGSFYLPESNFLVMGSQQSGLIVRNLDPQYKATRTLCIRNSHLDVNEAYLTFTANHPDTEIKSLVRDSSMADADEVTQDMMNGSSEVDIYELTVDSSAFNAMISRGYVADLSGSEILSSAVARMYPVFSDPLMKDGKVIAFPKEVNENGGMWFNGALAKEMGIEEPKTWDDFLDLVERWDSDFSVDYPEKAIFDPGENARMKETLMNHLLSDYETLLNRPGQEQSFNTPALRHLLERLDQIDYAPFNTEKDFSNGYSWSSEDVLTDGWGGYLPKMYGARSMGGDEGHEMLLSVDGETAPALPVSMVVYVVNPYSKNQDLAIEYLETCAQLMPEYSQLCYFSDWTGTIANPDYEAGLREIDRQIESVAEMVEKASEEEKQAYQQSLKDMENYRTTYEEAERYLYNEEEVKAYQDIVPYLVVLRHQYINLGVEDDDEMTSLVQRYVDGQMEAGQMLSALDQKLRMMQMESDD